MERLNRADLFIYRLLAVVFALLSVAACNGNSSIGTGAGSSQSTATGDTSSAFSPLDIAAAVDPSIAFQLQVDLSGTQMLPPVSVAQTARAELTLNTQTNEIVGILDTVVGSVTAAHIHEGAVGEVGAEVVALIPATDGSEQYVIPPGTVLSGEHARELVSGNLYIDLHTQQYPDGLLRAQLTNESVEVTVQSALDDIQATIFTPLCSGCHTGGGQTLPTLMNLTSADASYTSLVGVSSVEVPELSRVNPLDPDTSYIVHKIEGTQSAGVRMPFRGSKLSDDQISAIRQWIAAGAPR
ncbi:MAG: CHRD domain-containing protein [Pseudomonadota bacterium]